MANMVNDIKEEKSSAKADFLEKVKWFTDERCIEGLPSIAVLQVILALLLYMIASVESVFWLGATAICAVLSLIGHYKGENRGARIFLRVVIIAVSAALIAFDVAALCVLLIYPENYDNAYLVFMLLFSLSIMLFVQPVASSLVEYRQLFDLVLLRIIGIVVLVMSVLFCSFGLGYRIEGIPLVVRSFNTPEIFGMGFEVAIDNLVTRLLFCLLSLAIVFMSFKLKAISAKKVPAQAEENQAV